MNIKITVIGILFFIFFNNMSIDQLDKPGTDKRVFDIKSGMITFKFRRGVEFGEKIFIFDEWGNKQKMYIESSIDTALAIKLQFPEKMLPKKQKALWIRNKNFEYIIDLHRNKGIKRPIIRCNTAAVTSDKEILLRQDTLLEKVCQVKKIGKSLLIWEWKKLFLKQEVFNPASSIPHPVIEVHAIKVEDDYEIRSDEFAIPAEVEIIN